MVLDPQRRLGAGPKGSGNDYSALMKHPFFRGMDFKILNEYEIPIKPELIEESPKRGFSLTDSSKPKDGVVYQAVMKKKNKFFWNQDRLVVLLAEGKMNYYKDKVLYRGTINLTKDTKVVMTGKDKFEVVTPSRTYYLAETDQSKHTTSLWVEHINEVIQTL